MERFTSRTERSLRNRSARDVDFHSEDSHILRPSQGRVITVLHHVVRSMVAGRMTDALKRGVSYLTNFDRNFDKF